MRFAKVLLGALLVVSIFSNFIMYTKYSGKRPIFSVNGEGVSKRDLDNYIELRSGPQVKAQLVLEMLIKQEAKKQRVYPTDAEVNDEFMLQRDSQVMLAARLQQMPWVQEETKKQIILSFCQQRLLIKGVPVSAEEIRAEYAAHPFLYDTADRVNLRVAVIMDPSRTDDVKQLVQRNLDPAVIMRQLPGQVVFLGYNYRFAMFERRDLPEDKKQAVFKLKPGDVRVMDPDLDMQKMHAKKLVVQLIDRVPGHPASLDDPKTKEKITLRVAAQRCKPWKEYLSTLWANTDFKSDNPDDKKVVEAFLFPGQAGTR